MNHYIKNLLERLAFIFSWVYPAQILKYTKIHFFYKIYAFSVKRQFKKAGKNLVLNPPLVLDGTRYISLGNNVSIQSHCWISAYDRYLDYVYSPKLIIGDNVVINFNCHIACINSISIGSDTLISSNVLISDHTHGDTKDTTFERLHRAQSLISKGAITIGKNVWIGEKVSIMPGVYIGDNSIVGANSVVTKNIPKNCIAVGNPAKIIKAIK